jgi:hypothetical protein
VSCTASAYTSRRDTREEEEVKWVAVCIPPIGGVPNLIAGPFLTEADAQAYMDKRWTAAFCIAKEHVTMPLEAAAW